MVGRIANKFQKEARAIYNRHGLDYAVMNVCGGRFARSLHVISFNRDSGDERRRADATYRELADSFAADGVSVGRSPVDYFDHHMGTIMPPFANACIEIKRALDPNGIIAPGKYGIP